jgi:hypothetical protein
MNRFDYRLLAKRKGWEKPVHPNLTLAKPLLSSVIYYNYLLGMQPELTPSGMFEEPEKSQVYLDLIQHGAIASTEEKVHSIYSHNDYEYQTYKFAVHSNAYNNDLPDANAIIHTLKGLKKVCPELHSHATEGSTKYLRIDRDLANCKFDLGAFNCSSVVSSLGELYCKIELYLGQKGSRKYRILYLYLTPDSKIKIYTNHYSARVNKCVLKSILSKLGKHSNWTPGGIPSLYKQLLISVLYGIYRETGDLFDFVMSSPKEQQRSIIREGLLAGLNSKSIKPPQDGSLTDLIASIAERVTWVKYEKEE